MQFKYQADLIFLGTLKDSKLSNYYKIFYNFAETYVGEAIKLLPKLKTEDKITRRSASLRAGRRLRELELFTLRINPNLERIMEATLPDSAASLSELAVELIYTTKPELFKRE